MKRNDDSNRSASLNLTEKDWGQLVDEGGKFILLPGEDFTGKRQGAVALLRAGLTARLGKWSIGDSKETPGAIVVTVQPPRR